MIIPDRRDVCVTAVQHDPELQSEQQRVLRFVAATGASRATYFRIKAKLAAARSEHDGRGSMETTIPAVHMDVLGDCGPVKQHHPRYALPRLRQLPRLDPTLQSRPADAEPLSPTPCR